MNTEKTNFCLIYPYHKENEELLEYGLNNRYSKRIDNIWSVEDPKCFLKNNLDSEIIFIFGLGFAFSNTALAEIGFKGNVKPLKTFKLNIKQIVVDETEETFFNGLDITEKSVELKSNYSIPIFENVYKSSSMSNKILEVGTKYGYDVPVKIEYSLQMLKEQKICYFLNGLIIHKDLFNRIKHAFNYKGLLFKEFSFSETVHTDQAVKIQLELSSQDKKTFEKNVEDFLNFIKEGKYEEGLRLVSTDRRDIFRRILPDLEIDLKNTEPPYDFEWGTNLGGAPSLKIFYPEFSFNVSKKRQDLLIS